MGEYEENGGEELRNKRSVIIYRGE